MKQRAIEFLKQRENSPEAAFADTITAVNEGNLYLDKDPTVAEVEAVKLDDVLAFHKRRVGNAADFTFAFAGNFKVDSIAPLLARYIGSLPSQGKRTSSYGHAFPRFPMGTRTVAVRKGIEPKASNELTFFTTGAPIEELDMHRAARGGVDPERAPARDPARADGRHLRRVGRLRQSVARARLRDDDGVVRLRPRARRHAGRGDSRPDQQLRAKGPSTEDVKKQQEIERRELEVALKQNGMWTGSILASLQCGIDPRRIAHRRERIDLLNRDNLRETYWKYFPLDRRTVITLLPAALTTTP
jgi:zinc protease